MIHTILTIVVLIVGYLLGSLSSSIIICRLTQNPDPRTQGSLNPGATNMLRIAGKKLAVLTLIGDLLKGFIAVTIGRLFGLHGFELSLVALTAFLGHLYPLYFGFKGGKGVATAIGTYFALSPVLGIAVGITWIVIAIIFKYSSLAALIAGTVAPFFALFLASPRYFFALLIITILLFWRHRANIKRLREGTETKIGKRP